LSRSELRARIQQAFVAILAGACKILVVSKLAQAALDASLSISRRLDYRGKTILWHLYAVFIRMLGLNDARVVYHLHGHPIHIPAALALGSLLERHPCFGQNLARIAALLSEKYPQLTILDVGANVGDTAILLRTATAAPILCIEGSDIYYPLCEHNLAGLPDIEIVKAYADSCSRVVVGALVEEGGSGRIVQNGFGREITMLSLSELVSARPQFERSKLLKIDTDGFDGRIILGAIPWIRQQKPIIFWEYELLTDAKNNGPGRRVLDALRSAGYGHFVFYNHVGDYIATADARDAELLDDLSSYACLKWNRDYVAPNFADICAVPNDDEDLLPVLRESELSLRQINLAGANR
jgi:FkbM family methyltransferase